MFPKYLIGFLGVTTVAGGAATTTFLFKKTDSDKEKKTKLEAPQPSTISSTPSIQKSFEETKKFDGTLVFRSDLKGAVGRSADVFFKGEIFDNKKYEKIKKDKLEQSNEDDEEDSAEKIEIKISLPKTKKEIEKYLAELNKKIEDGSKERSNQKLPLAKFKEMLTKNKNDFEKVFGKSTYKEVLAQTQKLTKFQEK